MSKLINKKLFLLTVLLLFTLLIPIVSVQASSNQFSIERLAGASRIQTAIEISKEGWPNGSSAVVLTREDDFPDALAGSTLAAAFDSPILLTDNEMLSPGTDSEVKRLHPTTVYILGGTNAVSASIETYLSSKYKIIRLSGSSRYDTAVAIASYLKEVGKLKTTKAVIAYAQNFPDALAISSWAAHNGVPILLSDTKTIPEPTSNAIIDLGINQTIIVGGSGVISSSVESKLPNPIRYGGSNRYETAVKIIKGLELEVDNIFVATGENFPDALAGSALATKTGSAIVLVGTTLDSSVLNFLVKHIGKVNKIYVLGGSGVVSHSTISNLIQKLGCSSEFLTAYEILNGKKLLNFGDSIAKGTGNNNIGYAEIIGGKTDMICYNYAVGGAVFGTDKNRPTRSRIPAQVDLAIKNGIDPDYIIFEGGTNDISFADLGKITEGYTASLDLDTFCGGMEYCCKTLLTNYYDKKIIFVRVHNRVSSNKTLQKVYGDKAIEICKKWRIPYVDLYSEGELNANNPTQRLMYTVYKPELGTGDGTHPNQAGYEKFYVPMILNKMIDAF
jgi:putative cell wall-binding protein/lysophospholipase L1-like esterase